MKNYYLVELKNGSRDFKAICEEKIVVSNIFKDRIEGIGRLIDVKAFEGYHPNWQTFRDVITGKTIYDPKNYPNGSKDSALVYRTIDKISREEALKMLKGMFPRDIKNYRNMELEIEGLTRKEEALKNFEGKKYIKAFTISKKKVKKSN